MNPHGRQIQRAWLGAGLIVLLITIATFVFMLDPILLRLRSTYEIVVVLPEAPQLARGSRVWVSGRDVGRVLEVAFMPATTADTSSAISMVLELPTEVREFVRRDSDVRVTSARMIGDPVLDILPGTPAAAMLRNRDTLQVEPRPDPAVLMASARAMKLSLDTALLEMKALAAPMRQRMAAFERVQHQLTLAQQHFTVMAADLRSSPALALLTDGGAQTSLTDARATLTQLMGAFQGLQQRAQDAGVMESARRLGESSARLQRTLAELEQQMQAQGGTVDRMMRDSALVHAIAAARAELDSLIADAKRNPLRYVF